MPDRLNTGNFLERINQRKALIRFGMIVIFILAMALLLPKTFHVSFRYENGKPWQGEDLYASGDFPVMKSDDSVKAEAERLKQTELPVFVPDSLVMASVTAKLDSAISLLGKVAGESGMPDAWANDAFKISGLKSNAEAIGREVYRFGYINRPRGGMKSDFILISEGGRIFRKAELESLLDSADVIELMHKMFPALGTDEQRRMEILVMKAISPNLRFDQNLTDTESERRRNMLSPVSGRIRRGEKIIGSNDIVTEELNRVLHSYLESKRKEEGDIRFFPRFFGQLLIVSLLTVMLIAFLMRRRPQIFYRNRKLAMILALFLFMMALVVAAIRISAIESRQFDLDYVFLVPLCMIPMTLAAFFDSGVGFFGNILAALFAGILLPNGFEFLFIQLCAGSVAVNTFTRVRSRGQFFLAIGHIAVTYSIAFSGYNFFVFASIAEIPWGNMLLLLMNVVLTVLTYPFIYIFEKLFRIASDLTYVELLDTNHPLLKDLALLAPGTFHHSLQVSNMAEAVLDKIGGNGLQARAGALFHDIGKIKNPQFFIENQIGRNPHDGMPPAESAALIMKHVPDGIELAKQHNLPPEIIDFIRTHHGNSRVETFYRKHVLENPGSENADEDFRYKGRLPFSKETAVVMIVDSVEAASRSLANPTPAGLRSLVDEIIEKKVSNGQLKNSNLTFKDLETARIAIGERLSGIYHQRLKDS